MTDYTKSTNFASKDSLSTGNALKIVKGTEIDTEFNNLVTAVATKANSLSPTFTGTPAAPTATAGTNSTQLATTAYADASSVAANNLDSTRIDVASATTVNLTTAAPNTRHINITGTTNITGFTVTAGKTYFIRFNAALVLTNSASLVTQVGRDITTAAGDTCILRSTAANTVEIMEYSPVTPDIQIQSITASVASSALTITLNPTRLDFRSSTLSSGSVSTRYVQTALSVVVPTGATLGTTDAVASKLTVIALDNAGTVELAVVNTTQFLDEAILISTGELSTASDSSNTVYSTTARTNVAFRIVGFITSTQATAGTWATAPSNITGVSPAVLVAASPQRGLGADQVWTNVTSSRTAGTTYTNSTSNPIAISVRGGHGDGQGVPTLSITVAGLVVWYVQLGQSGAGGCGDLSGFSIIPSGATYSVSSSPSISTWHELR